MYAMFHPGHPFFIHINALFYRFLTFHWLSKNGEKSSDSNFTLSELLKRGNEIKKILNSPIKLSVNYDMSN